MKTIIDISWPLLPGMTEYKDRSSIQVTTEKTFEVDAVRETSLTMNMHTGTHVDAPAHFLKDGKPMHQVDIAKLWGPAKVLDLSDVKEAITQDILKQFQIDENDFILFKTANSLEAYNAPFNPNFIYLEKTGAHYLTSLKIRGVGIDYLGIERNQPNHETHTILLSHDIPIIEGLRLDHVAAGSYFLVCCPLNIIGTDAAPARAFLVQE